MFSVLVCRKLRMLRRLMALFINAMSENGLVEEVFEHTFYEEKGKQFEGLKITRSILCVNNQAG